MGGKDPNRQPKLRGLRNAPAGWVWMAACNRCSRRAALPVELLIRRYGEDFLVEFATAAIKCTGCGNFGAKATLMRLCEPGCARQRG